MGGAPWGSCVPSSDSTGPGSTGPDSTGPEQDPASRLERVLGLPGAVVVGVGAMLGTGVFVAWTPAGDLAGSWLLVALAIAAVVAALNAASTARLAADIPLAGGAYAYGRQAIGRPAGVLAGYVFVIGKSASAGAAALAIGAYAWPGAQRPVALAAIVVVLLLDLRGVVRSVRVTAVMVAIVLVVLAVLVMTYWTSTTDVVAAPPPPTGPGAVLAAAGLLFVAFAGYARVTVLGEEVRRPRWTIPRAVALALAIVLVVYAAVGVTVVASGAGGPAPLEALATSAGGSGLAIAVRVAAVLAAGAALLSLLAGIGRTLFAMADGGDAPRPLAAVGGLGGARVPARAEVLAAVLAAAVAAAGGIGFALGLSAVSILTYYGVAHVAAWRRWPRFGVRLVAGLGLLGCVAVAGSLLLTALTGGVGL